MLPLDVTKSDLEKIFGALEASKIFFERRDSMNAQIHLGSPIASPITSLVIAEHARLKRILYGD